MLASRKKQEGSSKNKRELSLFLNEAEKKRGREGKQVKGDGIGGKGRRGGQKGGKVKGRERKGGKGRGMERKDDKRFKSDWEGADHIRI